MINLTDWSILIVDDEPDNLRLLEDILVFFDARVTIASSGQEAMEKLKADRYRLILLDIQMAHISGFDVLKFIRENVDLEIAKQVVVAVTAEAMAGDRERILAAGFDGYISKPIDATTFVGTIEEIVATQKGPNTPPHVS